MNGNVVESFPFESGNSRVIQTASAYRVNTDCGVKVVWDPEDLNSKVKVLVPPEFGPSLGGLCGNCDGQQNDLSSVDNFSPDDKMIEYGKLFRMSVNTFN